MSALVVESKHERTKILATAFRVGVAANHTLLALRDFDLQPIPRPFFLIGAISFLGKNPFQATLAGNFKEVPTFFWVVVREPNGLSILEYRPQQLLPLLQTYFVQVVGVIQNRNSFSSRRATPSCLEPGPLLHQTERRTPLLVDSNDFSVNNSLLCLYESGQVAQFRKLSGEVVLIA